MIFRLDLWHMSVLYKLPFGSALPIFGERAWGCGEIVVQMIVNSSSFSRTSGPDIHSDQKFFRFLLIAIWSDFRGRDPRWLLYACSVISEVVFTMWS